MQLHKDGLIELNYKVAYDVVVMRWPDLTGYTMPEISYSIKKLVDTLRHYDIKNLLVDSRDSLINDLTMDDYQQVLVKFVESLMTTRLQKLARLSTADTGRELVVDETAELAINKMGIKFRFKNFTSEAAAYDWLRKE